MTLSTLKREVKSYKVYVIKQVVQFLDLNPIEDLWNNVEKPVRTVKAKNLKDLWEIIQKAWNEIPK